jgi:hypothetical protein
VAGIALTRAVIESVAVVFAVHERVSQFLVDQNVEQLDNSLMTYLMGSRNNPDLPPAANILTLIDRMNKLLDGARSTYDAMCESTHPNWAGTLGAFGDIDREAFELKLGPSGRVNSFGVGVNALSGALMIFEHYYGELAELIKRLNEHFEATGGT